MSSVQILVIVQIFQQELDQCVTFSLLNDNVPIIYLNDNQNSSDCKFSKKLTVSIQGATAKIMDEYFKMYKVIDDNTQNFDVLYTSNVFNQTFKKDNNIVVSQIPGYQAFSVKDHLAQNIMKYKQQHQDIPIYIPQTFILPQESKQLQEFAAKNPNIKYIQKQARSSRGRNINLFASVDEKLLSSKGVVQQYIDNPLLIDGHKFDLRIYLQCQSIDPLICYLYPEGITRLAAFEYQKLTKDNQNEHTIHLTNYAVNKNVKFQELHQNSHVQTKMKLSDFFAYAAKNKEIFTDNQEIQNMTQKQIKQYLQQQIQDCLYYSLLELQPGIKQDSRRKQYQNINKYFGLYGADVMFDQSGKAYLIEINLQPALGVRTKVDKEVKYQLVKDMMNLAGIQLKDQEQIENIKHNNQKEIKQKQKLAKQILSQYNQYQQQNGEQIDEKLNTLILELEDQLLRKEHNKYNIKMVSMIKNYNNIFYGKGKIECFLFQVMSDYDCFIFEVFVPKENKEQVKQAIFNAGGGKDLKYDMCCEEFQTIGQFRPLEGSNSYIGNIGQVVQVEEVMLSFLVFRKDMKNCIKSMKEAHPYEVPAYKYYRINQESFE